MGYTTWFDGQFDLDRSLTVPHFNYLKQFAETRRMKRDASKALLLPDPIREAAGLPIGEDGTYFVGGTGLAGQDRDDSILEYNCPSREQPGLWCQWVPNEDGTAIEHDGGEKFYNYVEWLEYLIEHFLKPWGYVLNGRVDWEGEASDDRGAIFVRNNEVRVSKAVIIGPVDPFEEEN